MKKLFLGGMFVFLAFGLVLSATDPLSASILLTNPGFENGLTGWTVTGSGTYNTVTEFGPYTPQGGSYFLKLDVTGGALSVYQDFSATTGDILSGWAGLVSGTTRDAAYALTIYSGLGDLLWANTGSTNGWERWDWTASNTGAYRLQYTLQNLGTSPSTAVFDAVPIPATAWLLGTGLVGLVLIRRRRKK